MTRQEKGDLLIQVTTGRAGLIVYSNGNLIYKTMYISGLPPPSPQKCPADPRPNTTCYHFMKDCTDDSSCPKQRKCCKQGCSYKCLKAV